MFPHYSHRFRGPSRILWFVIGAATASLLLKRTDGHSRTFRHCRRLQHQTPMPNSSVPDSSLSDDAHFSSSAPNSRSVTFLQDLSRTINNIPPWSSEQQQSWQQEKEHLADISRKVADAVGDVVSCPKFSSLMTS
jgi:hypothetical protein